jgi:hypothetical protein
MAKETLEERIQRVEKMAQRALDVQEIQNLMARGRYGRPAGSSKPPLEIAEKTPGVTSEVAHWGVYEGAKGIEKMHKLTEYHKADPRGLMFIHPLTTPVIEVAGDGKTAKGVWISPGVETMRYNGKLTAFWAWVKYGADFVKEDGQWKIWHNHVYAVFRCPYDKSWVEEPNVDTDFIPDEFKADRPTTYDHPYSPTTAMGNIPAAPEPYETWDPKDTYGPPEQ